MGIRMVASITIRTKPFLKNPIICYSPNYFSQLVLDGLIGHDNQIGLWWVWVAYPKTTIPYQNGCLNNHQNQTIFKKTTINCYSPNYYSQLVLDGLIWHDNQIGLWWVWVAYPKTTKPYQYGCLNNHQEFLQTKNSCYSANYSIKHDMILVILKKLLEKRK